MREVTAAIEMPRSDTTPQGQALRAKLEQIIRTRHYCGDCVTCDGVAEALLALQDAEPPAPTREQIAKMPGWRLLPDEPWMERSGSGEYVKRSDVLALYPADDAATKAQEQP